VCIICWCVSERLKSICWYVGLCAVMGVRQGVTTHDVRCTKGLDIPLISGWYPWCPTVGIGRNMVCFQRFFKFFTLWPLSTDMWLIFRYISSRYYLIIAEIFNWNLVIFFLEIRWLYVWYPADILDILISGVQISSKLLPLGVRWILSRICMRIWRVEMNVSQCGDAACMN